MSLISGSSVTGAGGAAAAPYEIERSLRFNSADSTYLNRTPASAGNRKTWTWSSWVKRSVLGSGANNPMLFTAGATSPYDQLYFDNSDRLNWWTGDVQTCLTNAVFRDPSAWYHIILSVDTTQATNADRVKLYVNGVIQTFSTYNGVTQNTDTKINNNEVHNIGRLPSPNFYLNGYLTEINFIDGQALTPSSFGEFNSDTGVWQPIEYTGTYGTNGFYLPFSDNASTTTLGDDFSGNGNDWTTNNFSVTAGAGNDSLVDSPTRYGTDTGAGGEVRGNYCTLNPLDKSSLITLTNGNLDGAGDGSGSWGLSRSTFSFPSSGKWYWEVRLNSTGSESNPAFFGVGLVNSATSLALDFAPSSWPNAYVLLLNGDLYTNNTSSAGYGSSFSVGDICMVAFDRDNSKIYFGRNGTWFDSGNPATETNPAASSISTALQFFPSLSSVNTTSGSFNFGQRPFAYTAPSGFKALVTTNLPTPTIEAGNEYFDVKLWAGNSSTQSIPLEFAPNLIWNKSRGDTASHAWWDVLRGTDKLLSSASTAAEDSGYNAITSFSSNAISLGADNTGTNDGRTNETGRNYVGWVWKANGAGVTNTDGTNTSTVSVSTNSGFSVVTYSGSGSQKTVGHGLGVAPSMYMVKRRDSTTDWVVYHASLGGTKYIVLNTTAAESTLNMWNNTAPTSTVFDVNFYSEVNNAAGTYVAYCFAPVAGYSAFGSYTGNGNADGPFVYTGFRPAFILIKQSSASGENWIIYDNRRLGYNVTATILFPNTSGAEETSNGFDLLSNGFKLRSSSSGSNANSATYIYAAFAENPFSIALAR
jgi:hypothetical protein